MNGYFKPDSQLVQGEVTLVYIGYKTFSQVPNIFNLRTVVKDELAKIGLIIEEEA